MENLVVQNIAAKPSVFGVFGCVFFREYLFFGGFEGNPMNTCWWSPPTMTSRPCGVWDGHFLHLGPPARFQLVPTFLGKGFSY